MPLTEIARRRLRVILPCLATSWSWRPLAYLWQASLVPSSYSVIEMGYADYGGGPGHGCDHDHRQPAAGSASTT